MDNSIVALVPCRAGSQRVPNKNTKLFGSSSLFQIKMDQLLCISDIDKIIVSTDDEQIIALCEKYYQDSRVVVKMREPYFASNECSNDEFVQYFADTLDIDGHLLWTHVTSPFCTEKTYQKAIDTYVDNLSDYDSLVSVDTIQGYLWNTQAHPINYDESSMGRWPKTQDIQPNYLINSAIFLIPMATMRQKRDRVGDKPLFYPMSQLESLDVDWPDDFDVANKLWHTLYKNIE